MLLLCVAAQWAQAQISGSATTYAWYIRNQLNEKIELKTYGGWSYSVEGVSNVKMTKDEGKNGDAGNWGAYNVKREYRAQVNAGETITITVRCTGIRGDECEEPKVQVGVMSDWSGSCYDCKSPNKGVSENRGPATATISYTVERDREYGENDILHLNLYGHMGGSASGAHTFNKPLGAGSLIVDVYLTVNNVGKATLTHEETEVEADVPTTRPESDDVGAHYEEDTEAWNFNGVWAFVIPASVIGAILGYNYTRRKEGEEGQQQEQPPVCSMQIYKDFGNTLLVGDMPQKVFARMMRKDPKGGERPDPLLTQMIQISSGDNFLQVADGGMQGEWRMAWVGAPETENAPAEGIVTFRMANTKGSYTNRLHFYIEGGEVIFGQPNITLPAHYEKEVRLPFVVTGIEEGAPVKVTITDASGRSTANYSVEAEWNAKERLYYAVIHDRVLDKEKDKGMPGKYLSYKLNVEAQSRSGRPVTGGLDLYRYYMGMVLEIFNGNDVKCFIEEYDITKHRTKKFAAESGGKWYVPAETKCKLTLFDYDEAGHRILQLAPIPVKDGLVFKAMDEGKQYLVDKVAVKGEVTACKPGDATYMVLRCTQAVLDAPNRVAATLTVTVKKGEEKITIEHPLRLCSQPRRDFADNFVMDAELKNDNRITDQLFHIRSEIYRNKLVDNLFPLLKYIDMVIDGYDPDFGYDKKTLKTITRTYNDVYTGVKAGANAEVAKPLTLADDMLLFIQSWYETAKTTSQDLGLCGRLFLGFATLGCSEIVFGAVDTISVGEEIYTGMKNYVDQGGDSIWGGFCVGAKVAVREYITAKVMEGGMKAISGTAKAAGLTPEKMKETLGKLNSKVKNQFSTPSKGGPIKAAGQRSTMSRASSKSRVKAKVEAAGKAGKGGKSNLSEATNLGKQRAKQNVNDLRAACEQYRANPTPENKILRDKMIMKCQADKQTMYLLKEKGDAFIPTRKDFNGHLDDIYKNTDMKVQEELSRNLGGKEIRKKNISSKQPTDLKEGKTVTMDRDTTYQYKDSDGVWKTIDDKTFGPGTEKMVEQTYNRHFHEQSTGIQPKTEPGVDLKPLEQKLANKHAKKMDQTIIQNELTNPESYGKDVNMMMDKSRHGERMQDARQVGKAVENKGVERFEDARKMFNDADAMTDPTAKVNKQADAIGEVREGCRQEVKIMDQFTDSMDIARAGENGGNQISDKLRDGIEIMRMCSEGTLPVDQAEANLRNIGYDSFEAVCRDHGATIIAIGS